MSANVSANQARLYHRASDIPQDVWDTLEQYEASANVVLPFAKKMSKSPGGGGDDDAHLWIIVHDDADKVTFVLSCTTGSLGKYPIFIVACKSPAQLAQEEKRGRDLADAMSPLVQCLLDNVPPQRVFSVFALPQVARKFSEIFVARVQAEHGIRAIEDLYYDATLTFCSSETLRKPLTSVSSLPGSDDTVIALRRADMSHLNAIKVMCKEFSQTSPPFILDDERAELEAKIMIMNQQVWIHLLQKGDGEPEVACLVATTRESQNVTAVTKVYTPERWRGHGCAARLLHRVCQEILEQKKRIVLYVGNSAELAPARKVYHKVGFQGLNGLQGQQIEGVERWIEIGFEGTTIGHW